jgi:DNA-binding NarL/FixJ family response regulator
MTTSVNQAAPEQLAQDLVALLHRLGLSAVVREPETAAILASSPSAEAQLLAAPPGRVAIASAKIAGSVIRVEAIQLAPEQTVVSLTPRQVQVADLLQDGLRNSQIGDKLGISPHTVRRHVEEILRRLGVANRTQAAADLRKRRRATNGKL